MSSTTVTTRYGVGTAVALGLYVVAIVVAEAFGRVVEGPMLWGLALLPALAIAAHLAVVLKLMASADEFVRAITAKRFVVAACLMMAALTAWGFLEHYAQTPRLPMFLVYPAFWAAYAVVTPFVRTTR